MGILTNFLKLLKPEPNDFVNVAKHISENYDKLDLNAKSNNETLTNLSNNKLDKGTYSGNATTLKADIDKKVSKSGDTMTGILTISDSEYSEVVFNNIELAAVGYSVYGKSAYLRAARSTGLKIYEDNTATLQANNLNTKNKEVVAAINELNDNKLNKGTYSGNASNLKSEIDKIASTTQLGRIIVGKGMTADSAGKVSVVSKNDGITVNGNDIQLNTVDNLINTSITKPLSANQGVILDKQDKGVLGGYNGIFPLTVASKNGIYLLPATNKFYVCIKNYNGSSLTAPNANFEELSVFQNRNKLENLFKINNLNNKIIIKIKDVAVKHNEQVLFDEPFPNKCLGVFLTDYTSGGINKQAISTGSLTKTGFTFLTEGPEADYFMYLAIGY